MKKRRLIPFSMMPGSWGLKGKTRQQAEAEYYYDGEELARHLEIINANTKEDKAIAELKLEFFHNKIHEVEFHHKVADIRKEPFVKIKVGFADPDEAIVGYFDFDWNDEFIKVLYNKGYTGASDEAMVNGWFNRVCAIVHAQNLADKDFGMEDRNNYNQERPDVIRTSTKRRNKDKGEAGKASKDA